MVTYFIIGIELSKTDASPVPAWLLSLCALCNLSGSHENRVSKTLHQLSSIALPCPDVPENGALSTQMISSTGKQEWAVTVPQLRYEQTLPT